LVLQSAHPESYRKLRELEALNKFAKEDVPDVEYEKPLFTQGLESVEGLD
jgi:hypothetical protein